MIYSGLEIHFVNMSMFTVAFKFSNLADRQLNYKEM